MTALMWQSCSSSYPDTAYVPGGEGNQNKEDYETYPMSPSLNFNSLLYATSSGADEMNNPANGDNTESKAITPIDKEDEGPLDPQNNWDNFLKRYAKARFYLLAYRKSVLTNSTSVLGTQPDYTQLMSDDADRQNCLLSTERKYISGPDQHVGKLAIPQGANKDGDTYSLATNGALYLLENAGWETDDDAKRAYNEKTYYWNWKKFENVGYDFFAYYVNKAQIYGFERQKDCVKIDLELNGKNDIMVGYAPEVTDSMLRADYATSITEDSIRTNILAKGDGVYSTYGAVHSVEPKINLKHALAYLKFRAKLMDEGVKVSIQDVQLKAMTRGKLTVAARDYSQLGISDLSDEKSISIGAYLSEKEISVDEFKNIGEGLLVPPADSYVVRVLVQQRNVKTEVSDVNPNGILNQWLEITCSPEKGFEAGKIYVLDLSVYGSTEVIINSDLEAWKSGIGTRIDLYE